MKNARDHCENKNVVAQGTNEKIKGADETNGDHHGQNERKDCQPRQNDEQNVPRKAQGRDLVALCTTMKITPVEDTKDAGESDVDEAPLKECIGDKSMEQETVSFRLIYLKWAMDRWGAQTNIL